MAILNLITIGEKEYLVVDSDPSTGGGISAPIATLAVYDSGSAGYAYLKVGALDTDWQQLSTAAGSGFVNPGVAGRLSLYSATGNAVDDVWTQNSQSIDVAIAAQPTRSAGIEYVIPNPGDAVTSADFILSEGAQTINGAKTLTSALAMSSQKITGLANGTASGDAVNFGQLSLYIPLTQKGANSGVATLDAGGKVPVSQLPSAVMTYEGTFDASATPASPLLNGDVLADAGMVYLASVAGSYDFGAGAVTFAVGDWAVYNGTIWQKSINSNAVVSVNGSTGVVTVNAINELTGDVTAGPATGSQSKVATIAAGAVTASKLGTVTDGITLDQSGAGSTLEVKAGGISNTQVSASAAIAYSKLNLSASIVNADIATAAAIAYSKLNLSASIVNADIATGAAIDYSKLNLSASIVNADIATGAAIDLSKLAALTASKLLVSDGSGVISVSSGSGFVKATSGTPAYQASISLTADVSGVLPIANGGTNSSTALNNSRIMVSAAGAIVEAAALTDGQLLIGSTGAAPVAAALTGTSNQVIVTNGAGSITLSLPQSIHTGATPTFAGMTLTGAGASLTITDAVTDKEYQATVNTTNATVTTLATLAASANKTMLVEAKIIGSRTGGTAGATGDSATYIRTARIKNIAGTITIHNLQSDYTSEDQVAWNATIEIVGGAAVISVSGAANNNVTWNAVIKTIV
jgi:hypothetical protein